MTALLDGLPALDQTATDLESLELLFALLAYLRPAYIVEAGTYQGHFAVGAARLLPNSRVVTFDPTCHFELPVLANLDYVRGDFAPEPGFGFAFVDSGPPGGEHDVRWRHWCLAKERANTGAVLACHDTNALDWTCGPLIALEGARLVGGRGLTLWSKP